LNRILAQPNIFQFLDTLKRLKLAKEKVDWQRVRQIGDVWGLTGRQHALFASLYEEEGCKFATDLAGPIEYEILRAVEQRLYNIVGE
jgi:hypothetical protein